MSKRTNPHKQAMKKHAAAMHNARYTLSKEFDALEAGRKRFVATTANGGMGVVTESSSVSTGTLAEFMENGSPGDVYVERGIEVVKDAAGVIADDKLVIGNEMKTSLPQGLHFAGHEPRDYQLPAIAAAEAMVGEHIPRGTVENSGGILFVCDSISPLPVGEGSIEDIHGEFAKLVDVGLPSTFATGRSSVSGCLPEELGVGAKLPPAVMETIERRLSEE